MSDPMLRPTVEVDGDTNEVTVTPPGRAPSTESVPNPPEPEAVPGE